MRKISMALAALISLQACGGTPFDETPAEGGDGGDPITSDGRLPPGTASPSPHDSIFRSEPLDPETGSGMARDIVYDSATDTFQVDNLAFDGDTEGRSDYSRSQPIGSLGPYAVYEADAVAIDTYNGLAVDQLQYRAIYGVSASGQSEFAIVRTGGYVGYALAALSTSATAVSICRRRGKGHIQKIMLASATSTARPTWNTRPQTLPSMSISKTLTTATG